MPDFAPLESQDVRDYWQHEEREFTPWLATEIEAELGPSLVWVEPEETRSGKMRSRIELRTDGHLENRDEWDRYLDWFLENDEQFHETFGARIQQLDHL